MLTWILAAGAVICLAYLAVIMLYSGAASAWIWLMFAAMLGAASWSTFRLEKHPEHAMLRIPVTLVTLIGAGLVILLVLQIMMFGRIPVVAEPALDYVIVLGAHVRSDGPSKTLKLRLDKAAEYALQNPETTLILSGGKGDDEPESEAEAMEAYLLEKGVPQWQMLLEKNSTSTLENLAYSWTMIQQEKSKLHEENMRRRLAREGTSQVHNSGNETETGLASPMRIGVVTSNFHLYRATKIAQKQGITDVCGIAAGSDPVLLVHYAVRDALAVLKDRLAGNL